VILWTINSYKDRSSNSSQVWEFKR